MFTAMLSSMTTKAKAVQAARVSTPWGPSRLVEEARVPQSTADKKFAALFQLLESPEGERYVRIAYTTDGIGRRGPVTLRARDLETLRAALERRPELSAALGFEGSGG
jgi:hypothetical protein